MRKLAKVLIVLVFAIALIAAVTSCGECDHENTTVQGKKDATCSVAGHTGKTVCTDCDEVLDEGSSIKKLDHKYDEGVVTKEATCISQGTLTKTCTVCNDSKNESIPTVAHQEIFHDALDGTHNITCLACAAHNDYKTHTPKDAGTPVEATCTEAAYTLMTCKDCAASYKVYASGAQPLNHNFGAWENTTAATCSTAGVKTRYCTRCDEFETIEITANANAHDWNAGVQLIAPTCAEEGVRVLSCNNCSASKEVAIPTCAHSYEDGESDGSGWVKQACSTDGCNASRTYFDASTLKQADIAIDTIPEGEDLELGMENATIAIPKDVIDQIKGGSATDVTIKAEFVDDSDKTTLLGKLTAEEKARLEGENIYDFGISGVSSFNASVTVTIPYVLKDGEDAEGILIWYVKENGEIEEVEAVYNATTETVTFSVEHFSFYAVAYQETQAMKCRRGVHSFVKTDITFAATCESFGYTVYECSHCHLHDIGDIIEKKDHAWGDLKQPTVTCTEGGYTYRECSKCGAHLESAYVRAEGHNVTTNPTCDTGASCTKCKAVVKPALGHSFGEWVVTTPATATTEGLKERSCTKCNEKESVKIAKVGSVEPVEFESYEDVYAFLFNDILGLKAGSFEFDLLLTGNKRAKGTASFSAEPMQFSFWVDLTETASDGRTYSASYGMFYDGKDAYVYDDGDLMITDVFAMMESSGADFAVMNEIYTALFEMVNPEVERLVKLAKDILKVLPEDVSTTLKSYVDAIETTYAYYALLLGFDTNLVMTDGVKAVTVQDIVVLLDALMTKTEKDGVVTYTFTAQNLTDAIDEAIKYIEDSLNKTLGDVFFESNAEIFTKMYPDVKSFNELITKLKTEFPGTLTLNKALEKLLKIAISQNMTLADVYEAIDLVLAYAGMTDESGKPISSKDMLDAQLGAMTLNDILAMLMSQMGGQSGGSSGDYYPEYNEGNMGGNVAVKPMNQSEEGAITVEALLDMVAEMLNGMTLGATEIPDAGATVADMLPMIKEYYSMIKPTLNVEIKLNAEGNITSANVGFNATMVNPETKEEAELASGTVTFTASANVTAPDAIKEATTSNKVVTRVEANGDVTVSGLPADYNVEIEIDSTYRPTYKDLLANGKLFKNDELSEQYGTTVYEIDKKFADRTDWLGEYWYVNGKFYTTNNRTITTPGEIVEKVNVSDFLNNPENYLPKADDESIGYIYSDYGENVPMYLTVGGLVYQVEGEWYVINAYNSDIGYTNMSSGGKDKLMLTAYEWNLQSAPYSDFFAGVTIDSIYGAGNKYAYAFERFYGDELYNSLLCISIANNENPEYADWGVSAYTFGVIENDEIFFVRGSRAFYKYVTETYTEVSIPEDYDGYSTYSDEIYHNGELVKAQRYSYYTRLPQYFVQVSDGVFVDLDYEGLTIANLVGINETITLPDGKTLYVKGFDGKYTYGYVKVAGNLCAQACYNSTTGEVFYRNGETYKYTSVRNLVDVDNNVIYNNDGTITIKKALIDAVNNLVAGSDENGYTFYLYADVEFDIDEDAEGAQIEEIMIRTPIIYKAPKYEADELLEDMFGGSYAEDSYKDWYGWFGYSGYGSANVVPNDDGTISIFYGNGGNIYLDVQNYENFKIDEVATKNEEESAAVGLPVYTMTQYNSYYNSYVKLGNSYYNYNTYSDHDVTFFSSAADIKASRFTIGELTLFIPANNPDDDTDLDVYRGNVYINGLGYSMSFYFVIENGYLYVLTGVEQIGEFSIKYENKMKASEYFGKLKIKVNPSSYWGGYTDYVNGAKKQIWYVSADVIEPASVNGLEDKVISSNEVRAVKNGNFFNYINTYKYNNVYLLEVGEKATVPNDYELYEEWSGSYTNGKFTFTQFKYIEESESHFIEIGGRFYNYCHDHSYDEESFKESFYEKKTLYVGTRYDGTTELLEGDYWGTLTPYDGELDITNVDKVNDLGWGNGEYDNLVEYVFYLYDGSDNRQIGEGYINGNKVYYSVDGKEAFIKIAEDKYFRGWLIGTERTENVIEIDGYNYYFDPYDYSEAYISTDTIEQSEGFKEIVKYTQGNSVIIISEEIFEFFEGDFDLYIHGNGNSMWIDRDQLLAMFDNAANMGDMNNKFDGIK